MIVGLLQFELLIHGAESLKDKRRVVRSVKDRLHREHMVAVAEVGALEMLNLAVLGVAAVGTDGARVGEVLDRISAKLRALHDAELGAVRREILRPAAEEEPSDEPIDEAALAAEMLERATGDGGENP